MTLHARTEDMRDTMSVITQFMRSRAPDTFVDLTPMEETVATAMVPARVGHG